jgi:hypothetical protein
VDLIDFAQGGFAARLSWSVRRSGQKCRKAMRMAQLTAQWPELSSVAKNISRSAW